MPHTTICIKPLVKAMHLDDQPSYMDSVEVIITWV
jgi:hypothetical protein